MRPLSAVTACLLIIVSLVCAGSAPGVAVEPTASEIQADGVVIGHGPYYQQNTPENATPVRHENPDEASEDDSTAALREALASRLGQRLEQSSVNLSEGQYEEAQAALGDEYTQLLSQYAEVSGGGDGGGETTLESFEQARARQRTISEDASEFQRTYQAYREAKAAGNETRARELARELLVLRTDIQQNASELNNSYTELQNAGVDTSTERDQLQTLTQNTSEVETQVTTTEFTSTQLSARTVDPNGSFVDPIEITGELRTVSGEPIRNNTITLTLSSQTQSVQTTDTGSFTLAYRPVTQPLDAKPVSVGYIPSPTSLYLGANASVNVSLSQTTATVQFQETSETAGYGDRIITRGSVSVNETPVEDLPLTVRIGNETLTTGRTATNGTFSLERRLDDSPTAGSHQLTVTSPQQNRSITVTSADTTIDIIRYKPLLTATISPRGTESVVLSGRLSGPTNRSVPNESLTVQAGNETITEVSTDANGTYEHSIARSNLPANASMLTVRYAAAESNLETVSATAMLPGRASTDGGLVAALQQPLPVIVLVGALLSLSGGGLYLYRQRQAPQPPSEDPEQPGTDPSAETSNYDIDTDPGPSLSAAQAALDRNDGDTAIITAYTAIRTQIAEQYSMPTQSTHWQFYDAAADHDLPVRDELKKLTAQYEQARYGPDHVTAATAQETVATASNIEKSLS